MPTRLQFTISNGLPAVQRTADNDERAVAARLGLAVLLVAPLAETIVGVVPAHPLLIPFVLAGAVAGIALAALTVVGLRRTAREHADALAYLRTLGRSEDKAIAPIALANVRTDATRPHVDPRDAELCELAVRFLDANIEQYGRNDRRIAPYRTLDGWPYGAWKRAVDALGHHAVAMPGHGTRVVGGTLGELRDRLAAGSLLPYRATPVYDARRATGKSKQ